VNIALLRRIRDLGGEFCAFDALGPDPERTARDLDELTAFGFGLDRCPTRGVAYRGPAARLCPDQIEYELGTSRVGRRVAVWRRVESTNDLATRAASSVANDGLVVLAESQTGGRGRRGRSWSAAEGSAVLMSVLLFPAGPLADPVWLTALAAVAVAEVVSDRAGRSARIKWPNDVRVDGLKIAGILVERGAGAVIGIGLNVNALRHEFPVDLRASATSLRVVAGSDRPLDRSEVVRDLIRRLDASYSLALRDGGDALSPSWRDRSEHLGRGVAVTTPRETVHGRLDDLSLTAGLRLIDAQGRRRLIPTKAVLDLAADPA